MISKEMIKSIVETASRLSDEQRMIYLPPPFSGCFVSLDPPDESLLKKSTHSVFKEVGIDREGGFYFVIKSIWGSRT